MANATIYDVAGAARVSLATVSRVLNNPEKVNEETRKRVLDVIKKLGYRPNAIARGLASRKTTTVGVVVSDISRASVSQMIGGIMDIAKRYDLYVIEDCCQAIGAEYKGKKVGTFGDFGCFSFYPTKNLGTMGDGGLLVTNSDNLKDRSIAIRNHGGAIRYHHDEIGLNSRLDEIHAAILNVKLPYIDEWNSKRRENAYRYNKLFENCEDVVTPAELSDTYCVYHQYTVKIPNRDNVHKMLQESGIGAMLYYPIPLHLQKVHEGMGFKKGDLPYTEKNTELVISLPMFPELTEEEQKTVAETLIRCIESSKALA